MRPGFSLADVSKAEYLRKLVFVATAYFMAGKLGLWMPFTSFNVSPVWPPSGIALAFVLAWGYRVWPGVALGAFLVNFFSPIPHLAAFGIALGNTLSALVAAFLLLRVTDFQRSLGRLRDVLGLVVLAAVVSTTVAASIGVTTLFLVHARAWSGFASAWSIWWLGDAMGVLVMTPLILTFPQLGATRGTLRRLEMGTLLACVTLTCLLIFDSRFGMKIGEGVLAFGVFPFAIWAAIRFEVAGAALVNILVAIIAVWETANHNGPFVRHTPWQNAALLQVFLAVTSITGLALAAVIAERERVEDALAREQRLLEEKERAEKALQYSQERLLGIVSSAMDAIISIDQDQQIVVFNHSAERVFRCTAAQAIGRPIGAFIPQRFRELHQQHVVNFGRTGVTSRSVYSPGTLLALRSDGEEFPIEATISQVEAAGEKLYTVILRDVSARKHAEDQLRQSQKMEAVGHLAGGIAHEFNNFLGIILGYSQLLVDESAENDALRSSVSAIQGATQRAASLTRQLLAFARKQVLQQKVLDINQTVRETHKLLRRLIPESIELVSLLGEDLWPAKADPTQIQQVLINLLVNARDAMPDGGKVVIQTANVELGESATQETELRPGRYVMLAISDSGCGMDAETQAHIFEPFFTTKGQGKGTGLGLPTIYGIVQQSGGHIAVESRVGKGTTVRIYLPWTDEAVSATAHATLPAQPVRGTETILVVEDEAALRELICHFLKGQGYTILSARDGAEAIEVCEHHRGKIHLVVTDLIMPRVNGLQLKERAAGLRPDTKFLFISGYMGEAQDKPDQFFQGSAFLEKPFPPSDLARKVREVLELEIRSDGVDRTYSAGLET
jgi:hypothetical protein